MTFDARRREDLEMSKAENSGFNYYAGRSSFCPDGLTWKCGKCKSYSIVEHPKGFECVHCGKVRISRREMEQTD